MKLLVFAHTPPPHHGQSYMVQLMLEGFGGDWRDRLRRGETSAKPGDEYGIQCFHVNAQVSDDLQDVGGIRVGKIVRLLRFCAEAIWCRFRYGVDTLYYVPAPAKRSAIVRDWVVMLLVRPWFKRTVLHWHAFGLGHWVAGKVEYPMGPEGAPLPPPRLFGPFEGLARKLTALAFRRVALSIVLTQYNRCDAEVLGPRRLEVVPNGIPDPCPNFEAVLANRQERRARRSATDPIEVLYLGHCMESKGLHDAVRMCADARKTRKIKLIVAGHFPSDTERSAFTKLVTDLGMEADIELAGFVVGEEKKKLFSRADLLLFLTQYPAETFGLVVLEALAFGLPVVTSHWRGVPELLVSDDGKQMLSPCGGGALMHLEFQNSKQLRSHFRAHFELGRHLSNLVRLL